MSLEYFQVDAFTSVPFSGNPAIVYRLSNWLKDVQMQRIAAEHNLAETAFVVREDDQWRIRWFTPKAEVPLCGHATLASAHVLYEVYGESAEVIEFASLSGALRVARKGTQLVLDFPVRRVQQVEHNPAVDQALGLPVLELLALMEDGGIQELMAVVSSEEELRSCQPDLAAVARLPGLGLLVTAPGEQHDFVSRYFAPAIGIDEDPVTGSTHCMLTPYWAERLGKQSLIARQCSARSGELQCELHGERVKIAGHAVLVARGELLLAL
ncbi:PhzF family phenazine biosynthesis protein [Ectopseudomonas mendocina]|uniref:PhzF family phenazine biosynthesis protein n=1 Tax=Ectopseudomonas mendocina TaxID=300 RepID=A0ABZ2RME0_ECTME